MQEKPYKCDHCKTCFADRATWRNHVRIHTGERPYKCKLCDKSFVQRTNLQAHVKTHTDERPFPCQVYFMSVCIGECVFCFCAYDWRPICVKHLLSFWFFSFSSTVCPYFHLFRSFLLTFLYFFFLFVLTPVYIISQCFSVLVHHFHVVISQVLRYLLNIKNSELSNFFNPGTLNLLVTAISFICCDIYIMEQILIKGISSLTTHSHANMRLP